jgi:hypothetical protein
MIEITANRMAKRIFEPIDAPLIKRLQNSSSGQLAGTAVLEAL